MNTSITIIIQHNSLGLYGWVITLSFSVILIKKSQIIIFYMNVFQTYSQKCSTSHT
jgi:hypothetical protein